MARIEASQAIQHFNFMTAASVMVPVSFLQSNHSNWLHGVMMIDASDTSPFNFILHLGIGELPCRIHWTV